MLFQACLTICIYIIREMAAPFATSGKNRSDYADAAKWKDCGVPK